MSQWRGRPQEDSVRRYGDDNTHGAAPAAHELPSGGSTSRGRSARSGSIRACQGKGDSCCPSVRHFRTGGGAVELGGPSYPVGVVSPSDDHRAQYRRTRARRVDADQAVIRSDA